MIKEFWHINTLESKIRKNANGNRLPGKEELVIQSLYSLISTGTERIVSLGLVPGEMEPFMIVPYMDGNLRLPVKYGYSIVGKVIGGTNELLGKYVHLMHPHQDIAIVASKDVTVIPDDIPVRRAVLASNMETALNALWDSEISSGDNVLICGFGIIGALVSLLIAQLPGVNVYVHEIDDYRKQIASSFGLKLFDQNNLPGNGFDVAINTSASEKALQLCIDYTVFNGIITELSWYGTQPVNLQLGSHFHVGQKRIISSQCTNIPLAKRYRYDIKRRKKVVFDLLKNNIFDELPFQVISFDRLPEIFDQIRNQTYKEFCTIVQYT